MATTDIFDVIDRLRATGRPFSVATVVRTADVTSAKAGAKAAVTEAGELIGHLGGACVTGAVAKAAKAALADRTVRMIRVKPAADVTAARDPDGTELFRSGCPSGGTVDILIEPYARPALIAILGRSPVAAALAAQAALMGFRVAISDPEELAIPVDAATIPIDGFDLGPLALQPTDCVVVAAQGKRDLDALRAALLSPASYVGMVASRRKAASLVERLRAEGLADACLARLESPAGLDLGGVDPAEIALAITATIVRRKNRARRPTPPDDHHSSRNGNEIGTILDNSAENTA